ncbi:hypothetical protein NDU88_005506 [Pleurodeles waltl]|uniref:Uncharacterized protein n=1 Tax=Pleurodeles waltl TaxID=8319 RepID=A0AAV7TVS7_PLEWA|nr:hypothetical protein NDU88_005506 [Pleurodeles waltl]
MPWCRLTPRARNPVLGGACGRRGGTGPKTRPRPRRDRPVAGVIARPNNRPIPTGGIRPGPPGPHPEVPRPLLRPKGGLAGGRARRRRAEGAWLRARKAPR